MKKKYLLNKPAIIILFIAFQTTLSISDTYGNDHYVLDTLTTDGAWCWFADPRAIYYKGIKEQTYFSWITKNGDIEIASYNHQTGVLKKTILYEGLQVDDHDHPTIYLREDGRVVVFFSMHTTGPMHRMISDNPEDISSFGSDYTFGTDVTYPYPFKVGNELLLFYRGINWHPTMIVSADSGQTFGTPQQFVQGGGARPYARYCSDQNESIHIAFTTGHPRNEANNKIYYACYKDGKFYKADGTYIKDYIDGSTALNIDNDEAETVYDASNGKGWIWDITVDENGYPVLVYAVFPNDNDHRYYYSRWNGSSWESQELTSGGGWFPQTLTGSSESEPNYSGGISLDYNNPDIVYLSKPVNGVFEIWKWFTHDNGSTWDSVAITNNTPSGILNVRPVVPRHHKNGYFDVLWMKGTYIHYTNYNTLIMYMSTQEKYREFDFGTFSSPVKIGANKITDTLLYTGDYGFTDTTGIGSIDRAVGDSVQRDFIYSSSSKIFKVDVHNGNYHVTTLQGDASSDHDLMSITANGLNVESDINVTSGNWIETQFDVLANENYIELEFEDGGGTDTNWIINSITIEAIEIFADSIQLDCDSIHLYIGGNYQLSATVFPFISKNKTISWDSENNSIAMVENGTITAIGVGSTIITASVDSGEVSATCSVYVEEPIYLDSAFFDFGTASSPLAPGAIRVSDITVLGNSYGWSEFSGLVPRNRSTADSELRDLIFSPNPATFTVYLNNGNYPVIIKQGDASYLHDNMSIIANGTTVRSSINTSKGQFITTNFDVSIIDGILQLTFTDDGGSDANWVINSIRIGIPDNVETNINILERVNKIDPNSTFCIVDMTGKVICKEMLSDRSWISLSCYENLPQGIYLLLIINNKDIKTIKFFKEKM